MKNGTTISTYQFFSMIVLFELGSAIVVGVGLDAGQDAWITVLIAMLAGLVLYCVLYYLHSHFPSDTWIAYLQKVLTVPIGWFVGFLYCLYFIYIATRVLRDFGDLLTTSMLTDTPLMVINLMMVLVIVYVLFHGINVLARTGEFFLIILFFIGFFSVTLIFSTDLYNIKNLLPILENGWIPVLRQAFPVTFTFPFGEIIVFTMLFHFLNKKEMGFRIGLLAIGVSGLLLALTTILYIIVLGVDITNRATFPLLTMVGKIQAADFIERLDALAVTVLVVAMFFKVAIFFYAGVAGISELFKVDKSQKILPLFGAILVFNSVQIAANFSEHLKEGLEVVPYYLHLPFQVGIPLIVLGILLIQKKMGKVKNSSSLS
ncbi:spore germination protein [Halalkalibacterium halodurans]|uniref:spore germination protein n=1 Tax=Halalkalibacterium halodurans TaxID=86665 RepID=UPI002AA9CDAB|nr:spore germination protein [Halalkalibacterium halodurans]MDY7222496.1 spore germination protein [Halalkalibacterium halodurans]MDY7241717.1 spore germination protein [Halalkalibacterium halodurans]